MIRTAAQNYFRVPAIDILPERTAEFVANCHREKHPKLRNMKVVGCYRWILFGGMIFDNSRYSYAPVYGHRVVGLVLTKQVVHQVLTLSFGELTWVNYHPEDIYLYSN